MKNKILFLTTLAFFLTIIIGFFKPIHAQSPLSLAITPPILEIMLQPGKEISEVFALTNSGGNIVVSPKIVYFEPENDLTGNVIITDKPAPSWVHFEKQPVTINSGETKEFRILISPPSGTEEIDHNLTFLFETSEAIDLLNQNSSFYKAQIGSNILLTISKDGRPHKSASIETFSAPKIIDSIFGKVVYKITLKNNGNSFWKPNGKIVVNDNKNLKIAPQNILSGSKREIFCVSDEVLSDCRLEKPFIGLNKAKLEFTLNDEPQRYSATTTTLSFPFSVLGGSIAVFLLLTRYIKFRHSKNK